MLQQRVRPGGIGKIFDLSAYGRDRIGAESRADECRLERNNAIALDEVSDVGKVSRRSAVQDVVREVLRGGQIEKRQTEPGVAIREPGGILVKANVAMHFDRVVMPADDIVPA